MNFTLPGFYWAQVGGALLVQWQPVFWDGKQVFIIGSRADNHHNVLRIGPMIMPVV